MISKPLQAQPIIVTLTPCVAEPSQAEPWQATRALTECGLAGLMPFVLAWRWAAWPQADAGKKAADAEALLWQFTKGLPAWAQRPAQHGKYSYTVSAPWQPPGMSLQVLARNKAFYLKPVQGDLMGRSPDKAGGLFVSWSAYGSAAVTLEAIEIALASRLEDQSPGRA